MNVSVLGAKKIKKHGIEWINYNFTKKESTLKEHIFHFQFQRQT